MSGTFFVLVTITQLGEGQKNYQPNRKQDAKRSHAHR